MLIGIKEILENIMLKYAMCFVIVALILVVVILFFDFKKYLKLHQNESVENNTKGIMLRGVVMTVISLIIGIIGIILKFI